MNINKKILVNEFIHGYDLPKKFSDSKKELLNFFDYDNINQTWNLATDKTKNIGEIRKDISTLIDNKSMDDILYDLHNLGIHPLSYIMNSILIKK